MDSSGRIVAEWDAMVSCERNGLEVLVLVQAITPATVCLKPACKGPDYPVDAFQSWFSRRA